MAILSLHTPSGPLGLGVCNRVGVKTPFQIRFRTLEGCLFLNQWTAGFGPGLLGWEASCWVPAGPVQATAFAMMGNEGVFHLRDGGSLAPQVWWRRSGNPTHTAILDGKRVGLEALPPKQSPRFWGNLLRLAEMRERAPWMALPEVDEVGEQVVGSREVASPLEQPGMLFCLLPQALRWGGVPFPSGKPLPVHVGVEGHPWPAWAQGEPDQTGPEEILFNHIHLIERDSPSPWIG